MNNSLKTSLRRFAAAIQLAHSRDVVGRAKANREVMGLVGPLVEELEGRLAVQSRYIMHPRASSYTRSINRKDRLAYGKFRAYAQEVKISLLLGEKEEKEAAYVLLEHLRNAGITSKMKFLHRLARLKLFVRGLTTMYRSEVELLGLERKARELHALVESLHQDVMSRTEERSQIPVGAHATARRKAEDAYARLIAALNGLKMMDTEGKLSELMDFIRAERTRLELSEAGRSRRPAVDTTGESADTAAAVTNTPDADKGAGTEAPTPGNGSHGTGSGTVTSKVGGAQIGTPATVSQGGGSSGTCESAAGDGRSGSNGTTTISPDNTKSKSDGNTPAGGSPGSGKAGSIYLQWQEGLSAFY